MARTLLGIVVGIALATVAFVVLGPSPGNVGGSEPGALPASGMSSASSDQAPSGSAANALEAAPTDVESQLPPGGELEERSPIVNQAAIAAAGQAAWLASLPPPTLPMALPGEFAHLTDNPNVFHERLQREMPDPAWFAQTEADLRSYFAAHPEITAKYGFPTIHCRTTACAVAFVSYGLDYPANAGAGSNGPSGRALMSFRQDNQEFFDGPLGVRFNGQLGVIADAHVEGDITTFYWFLPRGDQQTNAAGSGSARI